MTKEEFYDSWKKPEDFIVCFTSGSTGKPKSIKLYKDDMRRSAEATIKFFGLPRNARYICPLSLDYIAGKMMAVRAIVGEGQLELINPSNDFVFDGTVDLLAVVPSQVPNIIKNYSPHEIRNLIVGGAPLSIKLREQLCSTGIQAWITYGMTETASHIALAKISKDSETVFHALEGVTFTTDKRGCLVISRPGYHHDHFVTNDVVELLTPFSFKWLGRADNVINSGGIKIHPEELEAKITALCPELTEHIIIKARKDEKWGEVPELIFDTDIDLENVAELIHASIDPRIRPKFFTRVDKFEKTSNGKIRRFNI